MGQVAGGRARARSLRGGLALGFLSAMVCLGASAASREVNLCWTDTGIRSGQRPPCLDQAAESMFRPFGDSVTPVFGEINQQRGTILIPMPRSEDRPRTDAEWSAFAERLYQGMRERVQQGLRDNVSDFEIRTVQDIGSLGNLTAANPGTPTGQQAQCVRFTEAFLTALDRVKQDLARTEHVRAYGLVCRDGGYVATESIAALRRSPLDELVVVDGTARVDRAVQTSAVMNGHLTLINTAGDVPSSPHLVANLKGSQEAQRRDPRIRLAYQDTQASAPAAGVPPRIVLGDVIRAAFAQAAKQQVQVLIPYGVSMDMKVTPGSFKEGKPGELDQLRKELLKSRPPQGSVTWSVPEKGEGK